MNAPTQHVPTAGALLEQFAGEWRSATRHPFLDAVRSGSLAPEAFSTWLVQDYLFVADLLAFQARLLARAPRPAQAVLAAGLVGLEAELSWFEQHAARRGLGLEADRHTLTQDYRDFLRDLELAPYGAAIVALWALERAYLEAWRGAAPGAPAYAEFVEHWTVPAFAEYVAGLERAADAALGAASADEQAQVEAAFKDVTRLEAAFWGIAQPGGAGA